MCCFVSLPQRKYLSMQIFFSVEGDELTLSAQQEKMVLICKLPWRRPNSLHSCFISGRGSLEILLPISQT